MRELICGTSKRKQILLYLFWIFVIIFASAFLLFFGRIFGEREHGLIYD